MYVVAIMSVSYTFFSWNQNILGKLIQDIAVVALATCVAKSSATMVLRMGDKQVFAFHKGVVHRSH